jgi:hypothetical protein
MTTHSRPSQEAPPSTRSSISDLLIATRRESMTIPYDEPNRSGGSMEDLDVEDPLSGIYAEFREFEHFSKSEYGFIGLSCLGVLLIPSLFLLVTKLV